MKHKSKKVRRSKAAEGTRGGVESRHARWTQADDGRGTKGGARAALIPRPSAVSPKLASEPAEPLAEATISATRRAGVAPGPRAPSPLDELLDDLLLRAPVAREPWMSAVEKALNKFVGELNEIEAAEARA